MLGIAVWFSCARAHAQPPGQGGSEGDLDLERAISAVVELVFSVADGTSERLFDFLETVELFNFESEIDRLVADPRTLNDSTAYKLSLLPFHIRYPIYQQLVRQMTRQDELRSRRIHNVTPDAVNVIALRIGALADEDVTDEVRTSMLKHFSAREVVDLGFFVLAQRSFFPETEEGWQHLKQTIADAGPAVAAAALAAGAAFDVGALSRSGTIIRLLDKQLSLGWYAGFRRLGFRFRPALRAGMTAQLPGLELSLGLSQYIRPRTTDPGRALEFAVREGYLNQFARTGGWDAFMEGAFRYVLKAPDGYRGEAATTRMGFFAKRDQLGGAWRHFGVRFSTEVESDFGHHLRFATGLGLEHLPTGITTMLQSTRTVDPLQGADSADTQAGIFLAGTVESPAEHFVTRMQTHARLVREEWEELETTERRLRDSEERLRLLGTPNLSLAAAREALAALDRAFRERESQVLDLGQSLAGYLESRRLAYAIRRWPSTRGDLHGPLDDRILVGARDRVFTRLEELSAGIGRSASRLGALRQRQLVVEERLRTVEQWSPDSPVLFGYQNELVVLQARLRRESMQADREMQGYVQCRESARRIKAASPQAVRRRDPDPISPALLRQVTARRALPLEPGLP